MPDTTALAQHRVGADSIDMRGPFTAGIMVRAAKCRDDLVQARVGGNWWHKPAPAAMRRPIVVFASSHLAETGAMVDQAIAISGANNVVVVASAAQALPDIVKFKKVAVLDTRVDPWSLIEAAQEIFVAGDTDEAFIARLLDKPLHCAAPGPMMQVTDTLKLVAITLIFGTQYLSPFTGKPISCEAFIALASEWRRVYAARANIACCVGISLWKRRRIVEFLGVGDAPAFVRSSRAAVAEAKARGGEIAVWSSRMPADLEQLAAEAGIRVQHIEDGFIRSVGLGADFLPPLSIVLDRSGIYYNASRSNDLEALLSDTSFSVELLNQARALRRRIVKNGVTKYNLTAKTSVHLPSDRDVVLVVGQVENDRSLLLGGCGVHAGLDLLQRVRGSRPEAHIIYKPHPDVEAGHRRGHISEDKVLAFADQVITDVDANTLFELVDEVHTVTSLMGFEALLRGKPVTTYGQPFYAGWGLTTDHNPPSRRMRQLSLDELVAGALILYPAYIDPISLLPCSPEIALDRLAETASQAVAPLVRVRRLQGRLAHNLRSWRGRQSTQHGSFAT